MARRLAEIKEDFDVYAFTLEGNWGEFIVGKD
jgi:hypothetical protein